MSLRKTTPCDFGECPYDAQYSSTCEYWCGEDEPEEDCNYYENEAEGIYVVGGDSN